MMLTMKKSLDSLDLFNNFLALLRSAPPFVTLALISCAPVSHLGARFMDRCIQFSLIVSLFFQKNKISLTE